MRPGGQADLGASLLRVGARVRRRSFVGVITDGMEEPSAWLPSLTAFARRGADLRFVHLHDRGEWELAFDQPALFFSPEGGEPLAVDPAGAQAAFAEVAQEFVAEVRRAVVSRGGRYYLVSSARPVEEVVRAVILGGSVSGGGA